MGRALLTALLGCLAGCSQTAGGGGDPRLALAPLFSALSFERPLALVQAPGDARWYVVEQRGVVWRIDEHGAERAVFVDISDRVDDGPNEAGLLGLAFHPQFASNGKAYLSYTGPGAPLVSHVAEYTSTDAGESLDPDSERIILSLAQPYGNHNGGQIGFGPDGYLYIGLGDGGAGGDPHGHGQNTDTLLGAMLRVDVDGAFPYAIPPDNPFAQGGGRGEIFAWGLRNPWRWSFDRATGALWAGDVGQNAWEEIDRIERGGNYGWNVREGAHCYAAASCATQGLVDPVAEYGHDQGCSVTGGYVYRGAALTWLQGTYLYGDYCSGRIWGLSRTADGGFAVRPLLQSDARIASFAEGNDGELYLIDHRGRLYRLAQAD